MELIKLNKPYTQAKIQKFTNQVIHRSIAAILFVVLGIIGIVLAINFFASNNPYLILLTIACLVDGFTGTIFLIASTDELLEARSALVKQLEAFEDQESLLELEQPELPEANSEPETESKTEPGISW